jgi:hypothetical protein
LGGIGGGKDRTGEEKKKAAGFSGGLLFEEY